MIAMLLKRQRRRVHCPPPDRWTGGQTDRGTEGPTEPGRIQLRPVPEHQGPWSGRGLEPEKRVLGQN